MADPVIDDATVRQEYEEIRRAPPWNDTAWPWEQLSEETKGYWRERVARWHETEVHK